MSEKHRKIVYEWLERERFRYNYVGNPEYEDLDSICLDGHFNLEDLVYSLFKLE